MAELSTLHRRFCGSAKGKLHWDRVFFFWTFVHVKIFVSISSAFHMMDKVLSGAKPDRFTSYANAFMMSFWKACGKGNACVRTPNLALLFPNGFNELLSKHILCMINCCPSHQYDLLRMVCHLMKPIS